MFPCSAWKSHCRTKQSSRPFAVSPRSPRRRGTSRMESFWKATGDLSLEYGYLGSCFYWDKSWSCCFPRGSRLVGRGGWGWGGIILLFCGSGCVGVEYIYFESGMGQIRVLFGCCLSSVSDWKWCQLSENSTEGTFFFTSTDFTYRFRFVFFFHRHRYNI